MTTDKNLEDKMKTKLVKKCAAVMAKFRKLDK